MLACRNGILELYFQTFNKFMFEIMNSVGLMVLMQPVVLQCFILLARLCKVLCYTHNSLMLYCQLFTQHLLNNSDFKFDFCLQMRRGFRVYDFTNHENVGY